MIRKALTDDVVRITEIQIFGWRVAYRNIIKDDILFSERTVINSINRTKDNILNKITDTYVYDDSGIIKGFMIIGPLRDEDSEFSFELYAIYVDPCFLHHGIGSKLLKKCESIALEKNIRIIKIWTFISNITGRKFYEKLKFLVFFLSFS